MEILLMYAWLKIDAVRGWLFFVSASCGVAIILQYVWMTMNEDYHGEFKYKPQGVKKFFTCCIAAMVFALAIPSSSQTGVLVATYYGMKVVKSDTMSKLMELATMKANEYIDQEIVKVKKEAK